MLDADVLIVGLGAVGSAAAYHLARRGRRVLGVDRFASPHAHGSSHGGSRIIRKAYFEGAHYLPVLERAYDLWKDLEQTAGTRLLHLHGALNIGPAGGEVVTGARRSAERLGLDHAVLASEAVRQHFPAFRLPPHHVAVWEPGAGYLVPERCIQTHLDQARRHGADLRMDEPVTGWQPDGGGVRVTTPHGTYRAARLVLCAGGWLRDLLPDIDLPVHIERQVNGWFRPNAPALFTPQQCPIYIWNQDDGTVLYGFPDLGDGVKAGLHHDGRLAAHPDALERAPTPDDTRALRAVLRRLLPDADGPLVRAATCFYTNTPDRHYLIDRHPEHPQVVYASACSGHGFKASNAVGETLACLALEEPPPVDVRAFGWRW